MIEFLQDSIQNHDINEYKIYITSGDRIENDVGIHIINTKLSPAIIHSCRSVCSGFSAKHYISNVYCDKNTRLEIVNGSKSYKREHVRDYFIDNKKNMVVSSLETSKQSRNPQPCGHCPRGGIFCRLDHDDRPKIFHPQHHGRCADPNHFGSNHSNRDRAGCTPGV